MDYEFAQGQYYRRKDVYREIGIPLETKGGPWDTGYWRHNDDWFIFCNVGVPGRTGHDYKNEFSGRDLVWYGKTNSRLRHPTIQSLIKPKGGVYVFVRRDHKAPFTFVGEGQAKSVEDTCPVRIVWGFSRETAGKPGRLPEEITSPQDHHEGSIRTISVNVFERNPDARRECIKTYGSFCQICGFDFGRVYGEPGEGFIHVHHLIPLSEIREDYALDPVNDLIPVCPNCHAMIHRRRHPYPLREVRDMLEQSNRIRQHLSKELSNLV